MHAKLGAVASVFCMLSRGLRIDLLWPGLRERCGRRRDTCISDSLAW